MLVSYLGVDSPAASSPGVLGAAFSGYSGGRQRFVVDAGGLGGRRALRILPASTASRVSSLSGAPAALPAATRLPHAPSFRRPLLSRRGEALWERVEAGSGSLGGTASSESRPRGAVGSGLSAVESAAASVVAPDVRGVCCWWVWMVVRFVCVVRVPLCVRVSREC